VKQLKKTNFISYPGVETNGFSSVWGSPDINMLHRKLKDDLNT
jgi:hypothetical protein